MAQFEHTVAGAATIDLNRVAIWVRVVEAGSFTAAARALGRPKSSVSRAVQQLELELGSTLLQRTTRKLSLTRAGEQYLERARGALRVLEEAHAELINADGEPRGDVRITAPNDSSGRVGVVLAQAVAGFVERYPQVHVDMVFTGRRVDLVAEGVDLALRAGKLADSTLVARKLCTDSLVLVASRGYLTRHGTPKRFSDLSRHRAILYKDGRHARWKLNGPSGSEAVLVHGVVSVDEMTFQVPLAEQGLGIALVPQMAVAEALRTGRLVHVLPQYSRREGAINLVYPAMRHVPKHVGLLRDFMYENLKRELASYGD